ncbi:MAG: hypothetical protein IKM25_00495 [Clostridia bacterium]|nr:hypothetical protein [Clostridia bacterium]
MKIENKALKEYVRVMNNVDICEDKKQQIIRNCALYATSRRIRTRRYKITAVKKKETNEVL